MTFLHFLNCSLATFVPLVALYKGTEMYGGVHCFVLIDRRFRDPLFLDADYLTSVLAPS